MKFIHCADLHLDAKMTANLDRDRAKERRAELLQTFEKMIAYAVQNKVDAILIAGDLFDTKNISATARHVVMDALEGHPDMTFYYLKGNHDTDNFLSGLEQLPENLKLFHEEWYSYETGSNGRIVISGLELSRKNAGSAYNSLILDAGRFNIVMLHGQESETGARDKTEVINLRALKNKGIDYLALGHIHTYKEEQLDGRGRYCYSGCLEGRGFDECGPHGFVVLDVDENSRTFTSQFIPFSNRSLYTVPVDVSGCMTTLEMAERVGRVLDQTDYEKKSLLKIVLTGEIDVECEKNIEYLVKRFEPDYYFVKVCDETTLHVDIRDFRLDQSLKGEYVRVVMDAGDISEEDKAAIIRYGLRAIAGEEVES